MAWNSGGPLGAWAAAIAVAGALVTSATPVSATGLISLRVPNGSTHCTFCHTVIPERNVFGQEVEQHILLPPEELWPLVRDLDSDGDLQTNSQELGDPCHTWTMGATPDRVEDISSPGDPLSLSINPLACEEIPSGVGGAGGEPSTGGVGGMPEPMGGTGGAMAEPEANEEDEDDDEDNGTTYTSEPAKKMCSFGVPVGDGASWSTMISAVAALAWMRRRRAAR